MRTKLRIARVQMGMTQYDIAKKVGISRSHYSQIESGIKSPSGDVALVIKLALGKTGDEFLLNDSETPKRGRLPGWYTSGWANPGAKEANTRKKAAKREAQE